jgi:hypothetical protein
LLPHSENLTFSLEPVVQGEAVNLAALLVQLVGTSADALDLAWKLRLP